MTRASEVEMFDNRESEYLAWVARHPAGYVANADRADNVAQYPMIHRASHRAVSSDKIGGFTTGAYIKFCSIDLELPRRELHARFKRRATHCGQCMSPRKNAKDGVP
ncbi:hypothetical protein [Luteimonas sp. A482]